MPRACCRPKTASRVYVVEVFVLARMRAEMRDAPGSSIGEPDSTE
jgi:hypothetical protein